MANINSVAQTVTEVDVNALRATWDQAVVAHNTAFAAYVATPSSANLHAVRVAFTAERAANAAWKAGERALQALWRNEIAADEEARLQAMCEAYETLEHDYADYSEGFLTEPLPYALTTAGMTYLDYHYHTDSEPEMLAAGGDSPYADGRPVIIKPAALPYYYQGTPDLDERDRLENLAY